MYRKKCVVCSATYYTKYKNSMFCPYCRKDRYKKREKKIGANIEIYNFLRDLEEYNRKNNTLLSYGKYESLKFMEKVKKGVD